ncbi:MAG: hypothetical protein QOK35_496 [Pseudonocardiales bacterium]|jgi:hypothetical protein|nr:hypothetical protein [Pseudonocardiales bacterium]
MTVLRLWSDWCLDPFYVDEGDGVFVLDNARDVAERFGLPADVMREVTGWDRLYQRHLDGVDPTESRWPEPDGHRVYLERGRAVARLLRRHLPADVGIEYLADDAVRECY